MAGMFYSLQEVAAKLNKTEEEVQEIIKQGRLREFRDGPNLLFKVAEVEALMSDSSMGKAPAKAKQEPDEEISLAPEPEDEFSLPGADSTAAASKGTDVLGEEDEDYKLADDTLSETKVVPDDGALDDTLGTKAGAGEASLEEIEGDVNLDTFGSGSGLLDLSLQADDTSLGGILDEIYTPEGEDGKEGKEGSEASAVEVAAEAEQLIPDTGIAEPEPGAEAAVIGQAYQVYAEPAPDVISNALGIMLFLPLLAIIYTAIVAVAGFNNMMPSVLTAIQRLIWYIVIGAVAASGVITGVGFMLGSKGKGGKAAVKKPKAEKPKKEKKAKKEKKSKKGKEAPPAEPEAENKSE
ncbi:MAG: helix-turn-helix domain-containing protein [Phycisphaerae bacterium]|nr:helix-turn-helix domain-containing protein [Phycisphaerae bacterium]MDD5380979.1 helix-turn-helix domain-containing protein [Phycisphaerae bacterium]